MRVQAYTDTNARGLGETTRPHCINRSVSHHFLHDEPATGRVSSSLFLYSSLSFIYTKCAVFF